MEKVVVNIASYNRINSLINTLTSIYEQCDEINVCLNDYTGEIPEFLLSPKINLTFTDNSKGDAFKFLHLGVENCYFLTIDDDIVYPPNYVEYMISKCKFYNNKSIITLHGRNFKTFPIKSYYNSANERFYFFQDLNKDVEVQFGGTGVMCFHSSILKKNIDDFLYPNMADVWIGKFANENNIKIMCVEHSGRYLKSIEQKETIFDNYKKNDSIQTTIVNQTFLKKKDVELSIVMPTFNNVNFIDETINSIIKSGIDRKIEILIGIDACEKTLKHIKTKNYPEFVKFYFFSENNGPYVIKNSLSKIAESDKLLFFDTDDVMNDIMINVIIDELSKNICVKPRYKDFGGQSLGGSKYGEGVFGIKKEVFLTMNGFENWRVAADSDFMGRLYKMRPKILYTKDVMFKRRVHPESLTNRKDTGMSSALRSNYARISKQKKGHGNPNELSVFPFSKVDLVFFKTERKEEEINLHSIKNQKLISVVFDKIPKKINTEPEKTKKQHKITDNPIFNMLKKNIVANDSEKEKITQQRNNIIEIKNKTRQEINKEVFKTKPNRRKDLPNIRIK
jgi:glycosyltransferase involved in cell wall biosynthesis